MYNICVVARENEELGLTSDRPYSQGNIIHLIYGPEGKQS